jgi:prepilin-type N-terminal cleavage/methylation domain-containing protein
MSNAIDGADARHDVQTRRPWTSCEGVTLIEVLAAIFIMGVGLLAMLTLFPVGALSMRRSINEDRAGMSLGALSAAAAEFAIVHGNPPSRLSDLTIFFGGDDRYEDGENGGYRFTIEGASLMAVPAAPGKTGSAGSASASAEPSSTVPARRRSARPMTPAR